jgi:hypothetical protein
MTPMRDGHSTCMVNLKSTDCEDGPGSGPGMPCRKEYLNWCGAQMDTPADSERRVSRY